MPEDKLSNGSAVARKGKGQRTGNLVFLVGVAGRTGRSTVTLARIALDSELSSHWLPSKLEKFKVRNRENIKRGK